jgi:hypothetical protein
LSISALLQIKMNSNFNCSYMAMSSLTYILSFSVRFFSACWFCLGIVWDKNHIKIFCSEIWVEMIFGWPTFKIMCNTPVFLYSLFTSKKKINNVKRWFWLVIINRLFSTKLWFLWQLIHGWWVESNLSDQLWVINDDHDIHM